MAHYFTDEDDSIRTLIDKCAGELDEASKADYLVNCLVLKYRQGMTVKEIFEAELKAKKAFEADLARRK